LLEVSRPALRRLAAGLATLAIIASAVSLYAWRPQAAGAELGTDLLVLALAPAFYLAALGAVLLGEPYLRRSGRWRAEYHALVLLSTAGMILLAQARDFVMLFVALETLSIPLYVLTGFFTDRARPLEAALKYFTVGAFSSAFVAFGAALVYGATGSVTFDGAREAIETVVAEGASGRLLMAKAGFAFLLVGFGFKVALAPFHSWAADVYQGAPTPVTAFLSVGSKVAGFAGLIRLMVEVFPPLPGWVPAVAALSALTLVIGNCVAMLQDDIKRLIAYSGVSHAGFVLMGLVAHQALAGSPALASAALVAVLFYLIAYALMTMGAVTVICILEREHGKDTQVVDYAGLATRSPFLSAAMLAFMLSLGGMPPLVGFFGKWFVFQAAVSAGLTWLAVVAAAASVIGFYYYLRVVMQMYLRPAGLRPGELEIARAPWILVAVTVAGTIALGLAPQVLLAALEEPGPLALVLGR
jgi:NADH-quinone oxidoreductase subunit N